MFRSFWVAGSRQVQRVLLAALAVALITARPGVAQQRLKQTNLVSDVPGMALLTDPNLVNPWGISFSGASPFWIANNGTGTSAVFNSVMGTIPLTVSIPLPTGGSASPTGTVFNNAGAAFPVGPGGPASTFLFATEEGTIAAWQGSLGTTALTVVDESAAGASYRGLAIAGSGAGGRLYAANFHNGSVDVFDAGFSQVFLAGAFVDPTLPAGYAPFNVQNVGGRLLVSYAQQDALGADDVPGAGHGFVDAFDLNGNFLQRLVTMGPLNSPWGMTLAPSGFGSLGGSLLVGNFGNGGINAFDPATGLFLGALLAANGSPLSIPGLWGLTFGNGGNGGDLNTLYFAAGIPGPSGELEDHGLFGSLSPLTTPEPASLVLVATGLLALLASGWRRRELRA